MYLGLSDKAKENKCQVATTTKKHRARQRSGIEKIGEWNRVREREQEPTNNKNLFAQRFTHTHSAPDVFCMHKI